MSADFNLEYLEPNNVGTKSWQALPTTATNPNQQHVPPRLPNDPHNAGN